MWFPIVAAANAYPPQVPMTIDQLKGEGQVAFCGEVLTSTRNEHPEFLPVADHTAARVEHVGYETVFRVLGVPFGELRTGRVAFVHFGLPPEDEPLWARFESPLPPGPSMRFRPGERWLVFAHRRADGVLGPVDDNRVPGAVAQGVFPLPDGVVCRGSIDALMPQAAVAGVQDPDPGRAVLAAGLLAYTGSTMRSEEPRIDIADADAVAALALALGHPSPSVVRTAVGGICGRGPLCAPPTGHERRPYDGDTRGREIAAPELVRLADHDLADRRLRAAAIVALAGLQDRGTFEAALRWIRDEDALVRQAAVALLAWFADHPAGAAALGLAAVDETWIVRETLVWSLWFAGAEGPEIDLLLEDPVARVRNAAATVRARSGRAADIFALRDSGHLVAVDPVLWLDHAEPDGRWTAPLSAALHSRHRERAWWVLFRELEASSATAAEQLETIAVLAAAPQMGPARYAALALHAEAIGAHDRAEAIREEAAAVAEARRTRGQVEGVWAD